MKLLALTYPDLKENDMQRIENYRKQADKQYSIIRPHFTWVFPMDHVKETVFINEIASLLKGISRIPFSINKAVASDHAFEKEYHTFLIPEEGLAEMIALHDTLYSRILNSFLRQDIQFKPHITIGSDTDPEICRELAERWNAKEFPIVGCCSSVTVVKYDDGMVEKLEEIALS